MNKPIITIFKDSNDNRMFKVFFQPDPKKEDFEVGMIFNVMSVNRQNGEVIFGLGFDLSSLQEFENQI